MLKSAPFTPDPFYLTSGNTLADRYQGIENDYSVETISGKVTLDEVRNITGDTQQIIMPEDVNRP